MLVTLKSDNQSVQKKKNFEENKGMNSDQKIRQNPYPLAVGSKMFPARRRKRIFLITLSVLFGNASFT